MFLIDRIDVLIVFYNVVDIEVFIVKMNAIKLSTMQY